MLIEMEIKNLIQKMILVSDISAEPRFPGSYWPENIIPLKQTQQEG